jgi:hypothetical protein
LPWKPRSYRAEDYGARRFERGGLCDAACEMGNQTFQYEKGRHVMGDQIKISRQQLDTKLFVLLGAIL